MSTLHQAFRSKEKVRCLVIQMARLGDTLQSLMALRAAKQLYPQLEIHFLAREKFAAAAKRVPWLEQVIVLPTEDILGSVMRGEKNLTQAMPDAARWLSPLVKEYWDFVINWSFSESSSFLTALLPARVKMGYSRQKNGSISASDGWSHYMQAVIQSGIEQNIHLTDILTTQLLTALQIHVGDPTDSGDAAVTSKAFFALKLNQAEVNFRSSGRKWLGIQLGAGHDTKIWPTESWAKVANYILSRHPDFNIALLGGPEDQQRAHQFLNLINENERKANRVLNLVGQTDFDTWTSAVGHCQWVLAGDTAAVHLASVLGTRVLNVSVGPVRWSETGPYGNGHYIVASNLACAGCQSQSKKTNDHTCRQSLTPEGVYAAWSYASSEWAHRRQVTLETHYSQLGWTKDLNQCRVYRSKIRSTEEGGGVVYESMLKRPMNEDEWNAQVMGQVARSWYCGWLPPIGQELKRDSIHPSLIRTLRGLEDSCSVLKKILMEAKSTAQQLQSMSQKLKSSKVMEVRSKKELTEFANKLSELDKLIERLGATHPLLKGFSQMQKILMHNLRSDQISELGQESAECYQQLSQGLVILKEWIDHTLQLAKPVAVQPAQVIRIGKDVSP